MNKSLILITILFSLLTGCSSIIEEEKFDKYKEYKIDYSQFFEIDQTEYAIYISQEYCISCYEMEEFLDSYLAKDHSFHFYIIDVTDDTRTKWSDDPTVSLGVTSLDYLYFYVTPSIYTIKNKSVSQILVNYSAVKGFLETK